MRTYRECIKECLDNPVDNTKMAFTGFLMSISAIIFHDCKDRLQYAQKEQSIQEAMRLIVGNYLLDSMVQTRDIGMFINWLLDQEEPDEIWWDMVAVTDKYNQFVKEQAADDQQ